MPVKMNRPTLANIVCIAGLINIVFFRPQLVWLLVWGFRKYISHSEWDFFFHDIFRTMKGLNVALA